MKSKKEGPSAITLLQQAKEAPVLRAFDLSDFGEVMDTLYQKGYTHLKIAEWLSERLREPIKRTQVFYYHKTWLRRKKESERVQAILEREEKSDASEKSALAEMIRRDAKVAITGGKLTRGKRK